MDKKEKAESKIIASSGIEILENGCPGTVHQQASHGYVKSGHESGKERTDPKKRNAAGHPKRGHKNPAYKKCQE
jgi:hypothetical protein